MNDNISKAIASRIDRATAEAPTVGITTPIFTIESSTAAITRAAESGEVFDVSEAAELDMHQKLRQIARDEITRRVSN